MEVMLCRDGSQDVTRPLWVKTRRACAPSADGAPYSAATACPMIRSKRSR